MLLTTCNFLFVINSYLVYERLKQIYLDLFFSNIYYSIICIKYCSLNLY